MFSKKAESEKVSMFFLSRSSDKQAKPVDAGVTVQVVAPPSTKVVIVAREEPRT
jgi:hypothetical protein